MEENSLLEEILKELQYQRLEKENLLIEEFKSFFTERFQYAHNFPNESDVHSFLKSFSSKIKVTVRNVNSEDFINNLQLELESILKSIKDVKEESMTILEKLKVRRSEGGYGSSNYINFVNSYYRKEASNLRQNDFTVEGRQQIIDFINNYFPLFENFLVENNLEGILLYLKLQGLL